MERKTLAGSMGLARWMIVAAVTYLTGCELLLTTPWSEFHSSLDGVGAGTGSGSTGSMGTGGAGGGCPGLGGNAGTAPSCAGGLNQTCIPNGSSNCCESPVVPCGTDTVCDMIAAFRLDAYEVTVGRFKAAIDAGKVLVDTATLVACGGMGTSTWALSAGDGNMNRPINCVTWAEANAFCNWDGGRLPTLGEYRYAAKGGDGRVHPWGAMLPVPNVNAVFAFGEVKDIKNVGYAYQGMAKWGQYDLVGNVREWTGDGACVNSGMVPSNNSYTFGGSFRSSADEMTIDTPSADQALNMRSELTGFRCAR